MQSMNVEGHEYPFILVIENEEELIQVYHALNVSIIEYRAALDSSTSVVRFPADLNLYPLWNHVDEACIKRGLRKKE